MDTNLREEQARVDMVRQELKQRLHELEKEAGGIKSQMVEMRHGFWDEVTVNLDHADDVAETMTSIRQQAGVLSERERRHRLAVEQYRRLEKLVPSPYFGRIDLTENETGEQMSIYIGTSSFLDEDGETFLVYDWRAPVSSVYYDYAPGPIAYETPGGTITGEMSLKRQFIIRDGVIESMFDTGETIGDDILQQVLGQSADNHMKNIVATIQKEQNQIIRNDKSRLLVVQGAAGSGKTSAALQRVAYLLYKYRKQIQADQIVLFSPNPIFNSYVSTVLPELGEENMQQTTFQEYLERRIGRGLHVEDPFSQMEYVLTTAPGEQKQVRLDAMKFKASVTFLDLIRTFADSLEESGLQFRDLALDGEVIVTADEMKTFFYHPHAVPPLRTRIEELREWLLDGLKKAEEDERKKAWVDEEIELLDTEDYEEAFRKARAKARKEGIHEIDAEKDWLRRKVVRQKFRPLRNRIRRLGFIHVPKTYARLYENPEHIFNWMDRADVPAAWPRICELTLAALAERKLPYEDAAPYLYLQERLFGFTAYNSVRHVLVDEGQDFSPLQYEFLKRLFPRSKMTVLGDFNQAIHVHAEGLDFSALNRLYGAEETEHIKLTRSYRSTRQIVEFTKGIIPGAGDAIIPFNRDGNKPTLTVVQEQDAQIALIARRLTSLATRYEKGTVAVICKTERECLETSAQLQQYDPQLDVQVVTRKTRHFQKGMVVIPSYLAKGVEFDAVIIYDASADAYGQPYERKLLYTACTRAMHELHLFAQGSLSPFLSDVNRKTYTEEVVMETAPGS